MELEQRIREQVTQAEVRKRRAGLAWWAILDGGLYVTIRGNPRGTYDVFSGSHIDQAMQILEGVPLEYFAPDPQAHSYGGGLQENICQSAARDTMTAPEPAPATRRTLRIEKLVCYDTAHYDDLKSAQREHATLALDGASTTAEHIRQAVAHFANKTIAVEIERPTPVIEIKSLSIDTDNCGEKTLLKDGMVNDLTYSENYLLGTLIHNIDNELGITPYVRVEYWKGEPDGTGADYVWSKVEWNAVAHRHTQEAEAGNDDLTIKDIVQMLLEEA